MTVRKTGFVWGRFMEAEAVRESEITESSFDPALFSIGKAIRQLMDEENLSEADLCRATNLPQTTLNRLLSGQTNDPRISTLITIARMLKVTIEQLLGREPLVRNPGGQLVHGLSLPILSWDHIESWVEHQILHVDTETEWVKTERRFVQGSFAVWTPPSVEDFFGGKSLLLVDAEVCHHTNNLLKDGQIVLTLVSGGAVALRQVVKEGKDIFLKRLFSPYEVVPMDNPNMVKGVIVESRRNWTG
jgi:transcriptional regulator with XRE-family HTH domain